MSHLLDVSNDFRPNPTVEDNLMNMYDKERDQGEIVSARLAEMLNLAPATVVRILRRARRDNWITGKSHCEGIPLNKIRRVATHSAIRRQMLTKWLLMKISKVCISGGDPGCHGT